MERLAIVGAVQRLWEKAASRRRTSSARRLGRAEAGSRRPALVDGCGFRGRPALPPEAELQLYHDLRRSFPIIDVAITRLVQLCGCPVIRGGAAVKDDLADWMRRLPAGPGQRGLGSWLETHLDHLLVYGRAVGEIRVSPSRREVRAVSSIDPRLVRLECGPDPLALRVLVRQMGGFEPVELPPQRALLSLHAPQGGPSGASMLRSLPFAAETLSIIENATAQVWLRLGAPSFHVNWQPDQPLSDPNGVVGEDVTGELQQSFESLMAARKQGEVRDYFTTGNVNVSLLSDEKQILAVQEPFRVFTEQIVAVTGLPPWLLGLHWSSTERLSVQQADLLVAHIEAIRREVHPQLEALLELRQRLRGGSSRYEIAWPPVDLRDAAEQARADAWREQARERRIENARRMWELGFWTQERAAREADETIAAPARHLAGPSPARPVSGELTPPQAQ